MDRQKSGSPLAVFPNSDGSRVPYKVFSDEEIYVLEPEYEEVATIHIQSIFPQLVIQQIHNTLVAREVLPKGPDHFELVFHFFGYEDDTPEMRNLRIKQANLVGSAGYVSCVRQVQQIGHG